MSTSTPVVVSARPTVAAMKLAEAVGREGSARALGRRLGSTPQTIQLLCAGAVRPTSRTVERCIAIGILPADWFSFAQD